MLIFDVVFTLHFSQKTINNPRPAANLHRRKGQASINTNVLAERIREVKSLGLGVRRLVKSASH